MPAPDTWDITAAAETMDVPAGLAGDKKDIYALRVKGTSMIDALINDGDIVLMQYVSAVSNGEMAAVWLKEEKEVTLKKVYTEPGRVRLQPANEQMQPLFAAPDNVEIQGRVVAVIRQMDEALLDRRAPVQILGGLPRSTCVYSSCSLAVTGPIFPLPMGRWSISETRGPRGRPCR